jgi:hypothetical protein
MAILTFYPSANNSGWTNSQNGYANDSSYATAVPARNGSTVVQYSGFKIDSSIPADATINSVTLYAVWKVSTTGYAYDTLKAQVYINGVANTTSILTTSLTTTMSTSSVAISGLTASNLQDSAFKIYITASRGSSSTSYTASLNVTYVVVDYTANAIKTPTDLYNTINASMKSDTLSFLAQENFAFNEGSGYLYLNGSDNNTLIHEINKVVSIETASYNLNINSPTIIRDYIRDIVISNDTNVGFNSPNIDVVTNINSSVFSSNVKADYLPALLTEHGYICNPNPIYSNVNLIIPSIIWDKKIYIDSIFSSTVDMDNLPQVNLGVGKNPNKITANANITTPVVVWDKNISSPSMETSINIDVNINVKVYRKPPTMTVTAQMGRPKDFWKGSMDNPYTISTLAELQAIKVNNKAGTYGNYILLNDIDGGNVSIDPIISFSGNLDGKGYTIKNLTVTQVGNGYGGLFDSINSNGQYFININFQNITIARNATSTSYYGAGVLIGLTQNGTGYLSFSNVHISNCTVDGYADYAGGLVGVLQSQVIISNCTVDSTSILGNYVGGLIGILNTNPPINIIECCSTSGTITPTTKSISVAGGLIGLSNDSSNYQIINCYSTINFAPNGSFAVTANGGFLGSDGTGVIRLIKDSYYAGTLTYNSNCHGGFCCNGSTIPPVLINSYFDQDLADTYFSYLGYGIPKTAQQLRSSDIIANWGYPWVINAEINDGLPLFNFNVTEPFETNLTTLNVNYNGANAVTIKNVEPSVLYDFANNLPIGSTLTNYSAIDDLTNSGRGKIFANTTHVDNTTCTAIIPLILSNNEVLGIEYFLSSENNYDKGRILLDGTIIFNASGNGTNKTILTSAYGNGISVDTWATFNLSIPSGSHTLKIEYSKDSSASVGKDIFAIGKIYKQRYSFYSDKTLQYTNIFVTNFMKCLTIGCGELINQKSPLATLCLRPILPVAKTIKYNTIDFQSGMPNGCTFSSAIIMDDPTGNNKGMVACTNDHNDNSLRQINIPINLTYISDVYIEYFVSTELDNDTVRLNLDDSYFLNMSGTSSSYMNINWNQYPIDNPNSGILAGQWCTYVLKNVSVGNHTISLYYYKNGSASAGLDIGAISKVICVSTTGYYNAVYNGLIPKIIVNNNIIKDNLLLNTNNYFKPMPFSANLNINQNQFLVLDYIMKSCYMSLNANMCTNVDYFHIITTLLIAMGIDNESIQLNW